MSYQDKLDKAQSIKNAKKELEDFSDLVKLHQEFARDIKGIKYGSVPIVSNFINTDLQMILKIEKKDAQLEFIKTVLMAMNKLNDDELQYVFLKYMLSCNEIEIEKRILIGEKRRRSIKNSALFKMSIALKVEKTL